MLWFRCLVFTFAVILGATLSRWHGGGFFKAAKWLKNLAFGLPLGGTLIYLNYQSLITLGYGSVADVFAAFVATICILVFKATGHGGGFDLAHSNKEPNDGRDLERIERWFFLYPKAYNSLPRYWYDALILSIKGGLISLAPTMIIAANSAVGAAVVFLSGLLGFPLSYMFGWWLYDKFPRALAFLGLEPTELAEFLTGGIFFGSFILAVFMVI